MANEVTIDFGLRFERSGIAIQIPNKQFLIDSGSTLYAGGSQNIGTTAEAVVLSALTNGGATYLFNPDTTNSVQIGVDVSGTFYPLFTLPPGKIAFLPRLQTLDVYAKASASTVNLTFLVFQQ
jgi:hypothetical protein